MSYNFQEFLFILESAFAWFYTRSAPIAREKFTIHITTRIPIVILKYLLKALFSSIQLVTSLSSSSRVLLASVSRRLGSSWDIQLVWDRTTADLDGRLACIFRASDFRLLTSGFLLQASEFRLLNSSFWIQASYFRILFSGFWLQAYDFKLLTSVFLLQSSDFRLLKADWGWLTFDYWLLIRAADWAIVNAEPLPYHKYPLHKLASNFILSYFVDTANFRKLILNCSFCCLAFE